MTPIQQDAIDAAYFRYLLEPDHTWIEAWVHDTIIAQFPDSSPSKSPSLQAHQNANHPLTNISPNPRKRKQPVHHRVEDSPPLVQDLHPGWKQPASTGLNHPLTSRISHCSAPDAKFTYPRSEFIDCSVSLLSRS